MMNSGNASLEQPVHIKSDLWNYVCGKCKKPETEMESLNMWVTNGLKTRSDIILSISPTELKQVKHCGTTREMWIRLEEIYQSKGKEGDIAERLDTAQNG